MMRGPLNVSQCLKAMGKSREGVGNHLCLSGTFLILALKVLYPGKPAIFNYLKSFPRQREKITASMNLQVLDHQKEQN